MRFIRFIDDVLMFPIYISLCIPAIVALGLTIITTPFSYMVLGREFSIVARARSYGEFVESLFRSVR